MPNPNPTAARQAAWENRHDQVVMTLAELKAEKQRNPQVVFNEIGHDAFEVWIRKAVRQ